MTLTPLVYWAQRHEEIYLRVELTDAQVSGEATQHNKPACMHSLFIRKLL